MSNLKIQFIECAKAGYPARTIENAYNSDLTIAIAKDFTTFGEKLTEKLVKQAKQVYFPFNYAYASNLDKYESARLSATIITLRPKVINIAGNGIYTIKQPQVEIDEIVYQFLAKVFIGAKVAPQLIRSGGQTGIDEAGLKAAIKLGIPALCLAPKGWVFREHVGRDIADEQLFKARFNHI